MKYFGKYTGSDINSYKGSGLYWIRHLKIHGDDVTTEIIASFDDKEINEAEMFAVNYSEKNKIVISENWANLQNENAKTGAPKGNIVSENTRYKISQTLLGKPNPKTKYVWKEDIDKIIERKRKYIKGRIWANNGIEERMVFELPKNWIKGRIGDRSIFKNKRFLT